MNSPTDSKLPKNHVQTWLEAVAEEYYEPIHSYLNARVAGLRLTEADDLVQEVFTRFVNAAETGRIAAWQSIDRPSDDEVIITRRFLYRTAMNIVCESRRQHAIHKKHLPAIQQQQPVIQLSDETRTDVNEILSVLNDKIQLLPKNERELVLLMLDGLSQAEVAQHLRVSESCVSKKLMRIYGRLRNQMSDLNQV